MPQERHVYTKIQTLDTIASPPTIHHPHLRAALVVVVAATLQSVFFNVIFMMWLAGGGGRWEMGGGRCFVLVYMTEM